MIYKTGVGKLQLLKDALDVGFGSGWSALTSADATVTALRHGQLYEAGASRTLTLAYEQVAVPKYLIEHLGLNGGLLASVAFDAAVFLGVSYGIYRALDHLQKRYDLPLPEIAKRAPAYALAAAACFMRVQAIQNWF
jgi:hypothetical protein